MEKRWKARNGMVFNPLGGLHFAPRNKFEAQPMVDGLNFDLDHYVKQTWMPGVGFYKQDVLDPHRWKGVFKKGKRK